MVFPRSPESILVKLAIDSVSNDFTVLGCPIHRGNNREYQTSSSTDMPRIFIILEIFRKKMHIFIKFFHMDVMCIEIEGY